MKRRNKLDTFFQKREKRLKVTKSGTNQLKVSTNNSSSSTPLSLSYSSGKQKGGVVVQGQTVIVKSNFSMAGRLRKDGTRATKKEVGSHAAASLSYMNSHGADDIKEQDMSNIYDEDGKRLTEEEFKALKQSMENDGEIAGMRRIVIDPGHQDYITREEMINIVKDSIHEFQVKTGKDFDYKIAVHTDKVELGGNIHAHVLATGTNQQINMTREQLKDFKQIVGEKTEQLLQSKELEKERSIDKVIEQDKDKNLTLNQQIDKELDGKLDDKFREQELDRAIRQVYEQPQNNQGLTL